VPIAVEHCRLERVKELDLVAEGVGVDAADVLEQVADHDVLEARVLARPAARRLQSQDGLDLVGELELALADQLMDGKRSGRPSSPTTAACLSTPGSN
jgi:hypothetical protein